MKKIISLFILFNLFTFCCVCQIYIEPVAGCSIDLKNKNYRFKQINTLVQVSLQTKSKHEWLIRLEKSSGLSSTSQDSSFTLNTALPLYANADKNFRPALWSFAGGVRLKLAGTTSTNILSALMFFGLSYQKINVGYQYDKSNYIILNPDKSQERLGAFASGGLEYMRLLKKGRIFIEASIATAPTGKKIQYPSSFRFIAPLSFNVGYSILLSTNNHDK